jgi:hypothetical protein
MTVPNPNPVGLLPAAVVDAAPVAADAVDAAVAAAAAAEDEAGGGQEDGQQLEEDVGTVRSRQRRRTT